MPKRMKQPIIKQDSQNESDNQQLGQSIKHKDYITLKKNKPKPLQQNQQNDQTVQLFRNQQLHKYMEQQFQNNQKNQKKKIKSKNNVDPKQQIIQQVFFNLQCGWNVCLTGGIDKMEILDDIVQRLEDYQENVWIVHGFAQPLNQKKIYNGFGTHLIKSGFASSIQCVLIKDQLWEYKQILQTTPPDTIIYVVFYDLSNYGFLSSQMQLKLAQLLTLPRLRLITSIQNCKISLCWSLNVIQMFNFIFVNCNKTQIPITKLLKFLPLPNEKSQKTQLQISQIWKSLNRNQRQIAKILAQNELINQNSPTSQQNYLSFQQLLDACIEKIILSDDHQLRQNLIQLIDHRVIIQEIDKTKNKKVFIMKLDRRILQNIVNNKYDNYQYENN